MNDKKDRATATEVAVELGTSPMMVKEMIRSGELPIGIVFRPEGSTQDRIIIPRKRWEAWRDGRDLQV